MPSRTATIDGSSHEGLMKKKKNDVDVLNLHMNIPHSLEGDEGLKGPPNLVRLLPGDIIGGIIAPSHRARRTQPRSSISQDTCMLLQHQQLLLPTSDLLFPPSLPPSLPPSFLPFCRPPLSLCNCTVRAHQSYKFSFGPATSASQ